MSQGVNALSVLGSTGEGPLLSAAVQRRALEVTLDARADRPVIAGVIAAAPGDALELGRFAFDRGVDGLLVTPPYYYPHEQQSVVDFYTYLNQELAGPIFVYHIPQFTKIPLEPDTVARLADLPGVAGIKDSSRDVEFHHRIIAATSGTTFAVFAGSGALLSTNISCGGAGAIAASANLIPRALVCLRQALQEHDCAEAQRQHCYISAVEEAVRQFPFPTNWKASLSILGLVSGEPAFPFRRLSGDQMRVLGTALRDLGVVA